MHVKGIHWTGTCTPAFERTVAFFRNFLGLTTDDEGVPVMATQFSRYVQFKLPNGDMFEILTGDEKTCALYNSPQIAFRVDDVVDARREMESQGVEFIGPIYQSGGYGFTYFRAPDGHLYEIDGDIRESM